MTNKGSEQVVQQHSTVSVTRGRKDTWTCHAEYQKSRRIVGISDKNASGRPEQFDKEGYAYLYGLLITAIFTKCGGDLMSSQRKKFMARLMKYLSTLSYQAGKQEIRKRVRYTTNDCKSMETQGTELQKYMNWQ